MNSNYFNQTYYQNMPPSEVNWAELAQRWIMAKGPDSSSGPNNLVGAPSPAFLFHPPPPPSMPLGAMPPVPFPSFPPPHHANFGPMMGPRPPMPPPPMFGMSVPPRPEGAIPPPPFMPPPGYFPPANAFQQNTDNEEYKAHYDASLEQSDDPPIDPSDDGNGASGGGMPAGAMSHWFSNFSPDLPPPSADRGDHEWMMGQAWPTVNVMQPQFTPLIDTQMRKRLPAWILEGLEKAEKEKQKKLQKEAEKKRAEELEKTREARRVAKGKGKFDSDSETDAEDNNIDDKDNKKAINKPLPNGGEHVSHNFSEQHRPTFSLRRSSDDDDDHEQDQSRSRGRNSSSREASPTAPPIVVELSLEERKQEALLAMRRLMTMVLLEATDGEISRIARESLTNTKRKAGPKLLASSNALSALSALGDDEDEDEDGNSSTKSDDAELNFKGKKDVEVDNLVSSDQSSVIESKSQISNKSKFRQNLVNMLRPPTPEEEAIKKDKERKPESENRTRKSSPDKHPSSSSSHHHNSSSGASSSSRFRSLSNKHHSSSSRSMRHDDNDERNNESSSHSSSSRRHRSSGSSGGSDTSKKDLKRRSDDSPTRHNHSSSSSKKKKRY